MRNLRAVVARLATLATLFAAAGCGGGGGAAAPTIDLTGYWQLYLQPTGSSEESGPAAVYLSQDGATVDGADVTGSVSGANFVLSTSTGSFTITLVGALAGTSAVGTLTISGGFSATGTFRLEGFTPAGTMTAAGTIAGETVDMSTSAAIGSRDCSDPAFTNVVEVEVVAAYGDEHLEIDFSPAGLAVGTLSIPGTITATVVYRNDSVAIEQAATSGTVTISRYDGNGIAGSYALTLPDGGSLTGTFDVSFDIAAYDP